MNQKLTRRWFSQVAIASTVVAGLEYLAKKTFAQTPNLVIYGALPVPKAGGIYLQSFDVTTGAVGNLKTATLEIGEQLTGFTSLTDGTLVLAISPVPSGKKEEDSTRLVFVGGPLEKPSVTVSGLEKQYMLGSLLGNNDGSLYGLVMNKNGRRSVALVSINPSTGQISLVDKIKLPQSERFSNLAMCPNGTIYTTSVGSLGETSLVQLDLGQGKPIPRAQLKFNNKFWDTGLNDLVCSDAGQLLALAAYNHVSPYNLYIVDPKTGTMNMLEEGFKAVKIAIPA